MIWNSFETYSYILVLKYVKIVVTVNALKVLYFILNWKIRVIIFGLGFI